MKRDFLTSLMEDHGGLPEGWEIERDSVKTDTICTNQFSFKVDSSCIKHEIFIETHLDKLEVAHSGDSFEGTTEREFKNPDRAAVYVLGVAEALCEQKRTEETSSDEGLGELFG